MKKKILILLIIIFSLFIVACGKSKDIENERLENFALEESTAQKNMEKYNSYIRLYNFINKENPIDAFDKEYVNIMFNDMGFRELENEDLENFGLEGKKVYENFEKVLNDVKKSMSENPAYYFDENVEKLIETSMKLKENVFAMIDYYGKSEFKKDNYAKREDLNREYNFLLGDYFDYSDYFMTCIERMEYDEDLKEIIEDLEKNKETIFLSLGKFTITANGFMDLVFSKKNSDFSDKEIKKLEDINKKLKKHLADMKALTDEEMEKIGWNSEEFEGYWIMNANDIVDLSTEFINKLKKKESTEGIVNELDGVIYEFGDAFSSLVM
ncbi:DUF3829 domain-containing protein [Fusobacterium russii]|uniref:DUF3829 domain-containing protein n=1 Tax=Fusobacterium russii TaxID=854 RepID=UPI00039E12A9|nr:DUF3829 domain-containing protein [Fusobacterium russii]